MFSLQKLGKFPCKTCLHMLQEYDRLVALIPDLAMSKKNSPFIKLAFSEVPPTHRQGLVDLVTNALFIGTPAASLPLLDVILHSYSGYSHW